MRMTKEDTMAIIVDYQEKLVPAMHETVELIKSAVILVKGLKKLGIPMVVSQQYTKGLGETIAKVKAELPEDCKFIEKNTFTVYNEENKALIDSYGKKNIIVCGTETHICVLQTAIDLIAAGYNVFFPTELKDLCAKADLLHLLKQFFLSLHIHQKMKLSKQFLI